MMDDAELLRDYAENRSETAFAGFVGRRVGFVYATALRMVAGNAHTAQDVTQAVFALAANKAASLANHKRLAGWLHATTCNVSRQTLREARRRDAREQEAARMSEIEQNAASEIALTDAAKLRPLLDEALDALRENEREAVLLRYFDGLAFAAIGAKLSMAEDTARIRVARAVEKMRALFAKRGVTSSASALGALMTAEAAQVAPAGLAANVSAGALAAIASAGAAATAATASTSATTGAILAFMSSAKITTIAILTFLIAAGGAYYGVQSERATSAALARARQENNKLTAQLRALEKQNAAAAKHDPVAAGRVLLADHPEIGEKLATLNRAMGAKYTFRISHAMNLSAEQSVRLAEAYWEPQSTFFAPGYGNVTISSAAEQQKSGAEGLRELLGEEGFEKYEHLQSLQRAASRFSGMYSNGLSNQLGSALYFTDEPLTSRQAWSLAEIAADWIKNNGAPDFDNVEARWNALVERAKPILSPLQLRALVEIGDRVVWSSDSFKWHIEHLENTKPKTTPKSK